VVCTAEQDQKEVGRGLGGLQRGRGTRDTIFRLFLIVSSFIWICIILILTWDTHGLRNECRSARFDRGYMTNDLCIDAINV
jgi:hypothetical protein